MKILFARLAICMALATSLGCALPSPSSSQTASDPPRVEVAFSPDAGAEALILRVIDSSHVSLRLAGYSFTPPAVVKALMGAKRRGVGVKVLVDDRGNRGAASRAAMRLVTGAGIPCASSRPMPFITTSTSWWMAGTTETGSFNFSKTAAQPNSENVLVVWNDERVAGRYEAHWNSRWPKGIEVESADR